MSNEEQIPCLILQVTRISPGVGGMTCWRQSTLECSHGVLERGKGMCLYQGPKELAKRSQTFALGLGKASQQRWHLRCIWNDEHEFVSGHGKSGKVVSTKGVSRLRVCPGESQPKTFFSSLNTLPSWTHRSKRSLLSLLSYSFYFRNVPLSDFQCFIYALKIPDHCYLSDLWGHKTYFHSKLWLKNILHTLPSPIIDEINENGV